MTVPPITTYQVRDRSTKMGISFMEAKQQLNHERLLTMIYQFDLRGDRKALTEVLFALAERMR